MKIVVRVLLGLAALIVVAVAGGAAFLATLDPNEYRDRLTAEVRKATGRDLVIKGDLSVGISLIPTIVANDVSFANAAWGSRPDMAHLKRLETNLQILPLLSGEVRIGRIVLVEPDILLEVAADGRANWDFGSAKPSDSDGPPTIPVVQSVRIDKGKLRFLDQSAKHDLTLLLDRAYIDETTNDRLKLDIAGAYNGAPIQLKGTTSQVSKLLEGSDYVFDLEANAFEATARLKGSVAKALSAPRLGVDVALSGKDLNSTLTALAAIAPVGDLSALPPLGTFEIAGKATGPAGAPSVEGLRFAIGNTEALRLEGAGHGTTAAFTLDRFAARIKGSDLAGTASVKLGGKVPQLAAELSSKHFDLDDVRSLLPAEKSGGQAASAQKGKGAPKGSDGRVFPADPLPLDGLKAANGEIKLSAARVIVERTPISDITLTAVLKDGNLVVEPLRATMAEGRLDGRTGLNAAGTNPTLEANLMLDKINLGQLLKDANVTDQLTGKVSSKVNVRGSGTSVRAMMASLTGTTEVIMDEGRIASQYVELLAADLARRLMPGSGGEATKINCLVSRFDIKQGIATSTGLLFDTERMTVAGGGTVDLRQERLDLTINPEPKDASLVSLAVPLQIGGTFLSPTVAPTTASVVKGVAGLAIMGLTPLGALAALAKTGTGDQNPCVAALQQKPGAPTQQQPSNPVDSVTKGVQDTFRSIFGGGK